MFSSVLAEVTLQGLNPSRPSLCRRRADKRWWTIVQSIDHSLPNCTMRVCVVQRGGRKRGELISEQRGEGRRRREEDGRARVSGQDRTTGSHDRGEEGEGEEEGRSAVKLVNVLRGGARGGKHLPPGRRGRVPKGGGGGGWLRTCQCEHAINKRPVDSRCSMRAVTRQGRTGYRMVDKGE